MLASKKTLCNSICLGISYFMDVKWTTKTEKLFNYEQCICTSFSSLAHNNNIFKWIHIKFCIRQTRINFYFSKTIKQLFLTVTFGGGEPNYIIMRTDNPYHIQNTWIMLYSFFKFKLLKSLDFQKNDIQLQPSKFFFYYLSRNTMIPHLLWKLHFQIHLSR